MLQTVDRKSDKSAGRQIRDLLLSQIDRQTTDSKLPTEQEMCEQFGVSRMTVNKEIAKLTREGYLYRTRGRGTFVKQRAKACKTIKFLLPGPGSLTSPRHKDLQRYLSGVVTEAHRLGMRVDTVITTPDHRLESMRPEMFAGLTPDDNVFVLAQWWHQLFPALTASGCNIVYINGQVKDTGFDDYLRKWFLLTIDTIGAIEDIVDYLVAAGRKNILCFDIQDSFAGAYPVTSGFLNGVEKHGITPNPALMPKVQHNLHQTPEQLIKTVKETFLKKPFDAVICPPNFVKHVMTAMAVMGLKAPGHVAIVATRDSDALKEASMPISALTVPYVTLGREAARCFNRDKFTPGEKIFRPVLLERESSRKGAGNRSNPYLQDNFNIPEMNDSFVSL